MTPSQDTAKPAPVGAVLVIEDKDADISLMEQAFVAARYTVTVARSAREAFPLLFKHPPDAIILDINLPDLDGFHVARELKRNMMLRHIPLILISSRSDFLEKMRSFDVIVDEYLVRPYDAQDLVLRTRLAMQRVLSSLDANPLTRLPGNTSIVRAINARLGKDRPYAIGYGDLNNFKAYNDKYGFSNGDKVILLTARVILGGLQKFSAKDHFLGHIGGDDFLFICEYDAANDVCAFITETFDREAPKHYTEEDRNRGTITVEDRRGVVSQFPLVSIAIGLLSDEGKKFSNLGQINHSLTHLKKYAKSFQGSAYVRDRRSLSARLAEFTWGPGSSAGSSEFLESITEALGSYLPGQLAELIDKGSVSILLQPVIDIATDEIIGHEALVRGPAETPLEYPDALFQTARTAGRVLDLDLLCMRKLCELSSELRPGLSLFVNVFPETLLEEARFTREVLENPKLRHFRLVFELAGSQRASDPAELFSALNGLKAHGHRVCVDATMLMQGTGIQFLPDLRPDFIKLNMTPFKDMSNDYLKQDEFAKTVGLIRGIGADVICVRLESQADSFFAQRAGVRLGQGFLFARPSRPNAATV